MVAAVLFYNPYFKKFMGIEELKLEREDKIDSRRWNQNILRLVTDVTNALDARLEEHPTEKVPMLKIINPINEAENKEDVLTLVDIVRRTHRILAFTKSAPKRAQAFMLKMLDNQTFVLGFYNDCLVYYEQSNLFIQASCNDPRIEQSKFNLYYEKEPVSEYAVEERAVLHSMCKGCNNRRRSTTPQIKEINEIRDANAMIVVDLDRHECIFQGGKSPADLGITLKHTEQIDDGDNESAMDNTGLEVHNLSSVLNLKAPMPEGARRYTNLTKQNERKVKNNDRKVRNGRGSRRVHHSKDSSDRNEATKNRRGGASEHRANGRHVRRITKVVEEHKHDHESDNADYRSV